jgi:autotransporter-associated beta strand protein
MKNKASLLTARKTLIAFSLLASSAFAGNLWDGGGADNNWGTAANWSPDGTPAPGTGNDIFFAGTTRLTPFNNYTAFDSWRNIIFNSGAGAFNITGNSINLYGKIENQGSTGVTVGFDAIAMQSATNNEFDPTNGNLTITSANIYTNGNQLKVWGNNGFTLTFAAGTNISQTGSLSINQNSNVIFKSAHSYSGDTFVNAGKLQFDTGGSATSSIIRLGDTTGTVNAEVDLIAAAGGQTLSSTVNARSGSSGTKTLASLNTSGSNTITSSIFLDSALTIQQAAGGSVSFSTGTFDIKGQSLTVNSAGTTTISQALSSSLGAGGSLLKQGNGILILSGTSNTYTGTTASTLNANGTQINAGTLGIYGDGSLGLAPSGAYNNIQFTGNGTLQDTANNISLDAKRNISVASAVTASFDSNGNNLTVNGVINGSGGNVSKIGTGTVTFNGTNTYTGTTTVSAGTLVVSSTGSLSSNSSITISANGTLQYNSSTASGPVSVSGILQGTGTVGAVTVNSGGSLAPGNSPGILTTGNLSLLSGGTLTAEINSTTVGSGYDQVNVSGTVDLAGALSVTLGGGYTPTNGTLFFLVSNDSTDAITGRFSNANFANNVEFTLGGQRWFISYAANYTGGGGGTFTGGNDVALYAIPEPSTFALIGMGGLAMGFIARRRKG